MKNDRVQERNKYQPQKERSDTREDTAEARGTVKTVTINQ